LAEGRGLGKIGIVADNMNFKIERNRKKLVAANAIDLIDRWLFPTKSVAGWFWQSDEMFH
jgi:hypothetical protein